MEGKPARRLASIRKPGGVNSALNPAPYILQRLSVMVKKMFGMNIYDTVLLFSMFFILYVAFLLSFVVIEYTLISFVVLSEFA